MIMRLARVLVPAGIALALAGTAIAAAPAAHRMTVALPDGGSAIIDYRGDVPPKVRLVPNANWTPVGMSDPVVWPDFADFERMTTTLNEQVDAMMRQANLIAAMPSGGQASLAAYGNLPVGATSYSSVTTVTDEGSCTRTTEMTSMGANKPPKIVSSSSGNCATGLSTPVPGKALDHT
jgi:hypothetical protein